MVKIIKREKYKVQSNSEKGKFYKVELLFGELWTCDCLCATMSGTECSHICEVKNERWLKNLTK